MSETSNGMPDLSTGDSEPSMEDILASIRKIIADDKSEVPEIDTENEGIMAQDISEPVEPTSFTEKVEEQQFEIPEVEGTSQEFDDLIAEATESELDISEIEDDEVLDLINFANNDPDSVSEAPDSDDIDDIVADGEDLVAEDSEPEASFDESLDLVMDSDASDYYSASAESDENRLLREEIENELSADAGTFEPVVASDDSAEILEAMDDIAEAPDLDDLTSDLLDEDDELISEFSDEDVELTGDLLDEDQVDFSTEDVSETPDLLQAEEEEEAEFEEFDTNAFDEADVDEADGTSEDQDMDLVKSLLADLMDEQDAEEFDEDDSIEAEDVFASFADDEPQDADESEELSDSDNIMDEILHQSVEDENAIAEMIADPDDQDESELAQIARTAREAAATPYQPTDTIRPEDKVELPERNLDKRLNLSAAAGFVGVAAGATLVGKPAESVDEELDEQISQIVEEELELEEIEELLEMIEEAEAESEDVIDEQAEEEQAALEQLVEELESPMEDENMGRTAKKESLVDEEIESESSEAFAALSHVVQEKAEMEENGPPIGDLVQDALRPMLKEWLDKNLKGIVERAVTKEVKRISSGK